MARTTRRRTAGSGAAGEQTRRVRENLPRPSAAAPPPAGVARPTAPARRRNPFGFFGRLQPRFVADVISELRKVTWPTASDTRYLTIVVAIVSVTVGAALGGVDLVFGWMIEQVFF